MHTHSSSKHTRTDAHRAREQGDCWHTTLPSSPEDLVEDKRESSEEQRGAERSREEKRRGEEERRREEGSREEKTREEKERNREEKRGEQTFGERESEPGPRRPRLQDEQNFPGLQSEAVLFPALGFLNYSPAAASDERPTAS